MITVLLVDDEAIDLEWMRRRVTGSPLPLQVVGTASSGFEALRLMEDERIDVILSDIRMPIMSGTEFARKAKERNPHVQVVFISGHEDFQYAKEAIQMNASGYLLKPVKDQELHEMLETVYTQVESERKRHSIVTEALSLVNRELMLKWLADATEEHEREHIAPFLHSLLQYGAAAAVIEIDDVEWKIPEQERRSQVRSISSFIEQFVGDHDGGTVLVSHDQRIVILSPISDDRFNAMLEELVGEVRQSFPVTITAGAGSSARDTEELRESYRQAQAALSAKWLLGKNRLIKDVSGTAREDKLEPNVEENVEEMLNAILDYDLVAIDDRLLKLFDKNESVSQKQYAYDLIIRVTSKLHADLLQQNENLYELLKWDAQKAAVLFQFETIDDILSWLRRRFFELSELLYVKRQKQKRKLFDNIMAFVDERLEQKITLKEVAAFFDFTPNYLSTLFKEETGTLFSDWLNERRMDRVRELLADPCLKVYEIAERVGYKNIIYFNRQFKQFTGMTPGEYRKKHKI
ncbi:DNA-binding response regulator [Paenibacillus glycanilyticus]|uniref:DNA-binding response regulator n=1 Tax=Paenibacillus glycanilyticus TaxID=126569 RepID=A0ABQ6NN86_9BACL|nr:response regulator [Paenibacillus glycanilyticus]GMK46543.1 DNA-binding response regulator [Paenibacillus glycanilyticus]